MLLATTLAIAVCSTAFIVLCYYLIEVRRPKLNAIKLANASSNTSPPGGITFWLDGEGNFCSSLDRGPIQPAPTDGWRRFEYDDRDRLLEEIRQRIVLINNTIEKEGPTEKILIRSVWERLKEDD